MTRALIMALLLAASSGPVLAQGAGGITVDGAFSRATAGQAPGAGYMTIHGGPAADRLLSASSPAAAKVELHTMVMDGQVMRMREVQAIDVPANGSVTLRPNGGLHLMLVGLKSPLRAGDDVPVTLHFEKAGDVPVTLKVQAPGAMGTGHAGH